MNEKVSAHFAEQAMYCEMFGSPFTAQLIACMNEDLAAGGPVADLVGAWPTNPRADALALRLTGALHAAALTKRDPALAALYPAQNPSWRMDDVWPAARAFLERERTWVSGFIRSAPQTNETRRSITLLAGFLTFAQTWSGPIDTLEIGASAGLNLNWDRFAYRTSSWSWGEASPVVIDTDWNGNPPPIGPLTVRNRAACDLNPLDVRDDAQRLQLKSYIWADQPDRLARFDGAVALALRSDVRVERADAAEWLAHKLAARAQDAATIVYHSVFLQYPPREARSAIIAAIESTGAKATESAPLAWVRLEPEALLDGVQDSPRMVADLVTWPGGHRRVIAYTDGHVRAVYAGAQT
ncbi:MAG: DUF2332 domain-containing protein [Hyphomonadaceae bacterium]